MAGDPVEINPSTGSGYRVMSVDEWAARFRRSEEFPLCLACDCSNTKEHAFTQVTTGVLLCAMLVCACAAQDLPEPIVASAPSHTSLPPSRPDLVPWQACVGERGAVLGLPQIQLAGVQGP